MDVRVGLWRKLSTIDAFWTVLLEKTLESPLDCKEISPRCSLEGLMLKLKLQYFASIWCEELTHLKRPWCWEGLGAGGEGDDRGWDGWMASLTHGHGFGWTLGVGDGQGGLVWCNSWGCRVGHDWATELNWTELKQLSMNAHMTEIILCVKISLLLSFTEDWKFWS